MTRVYLGLASNIERERHITAGLDALTEHYGPLALSSVYESAAVGFEGEPFLNMAVGLDTDVEVGAMARHLRQLEYAHGRPPHPSRFSARTLDIDILVFGDLVGTFDGVQLPRPEITENAFVLCPLAELAPTAMHPTEGRSYAELWREYPAERQPLEAVEFHWRGRRISSPFRPAGSGPRPRR